MIMKKICLSILLLLGCVQAINACDICGCGSGSFYIGILPDFNSKIAGIRYRYNNITTHIGPGGTTSYLTTNEHYHTTELWGGWTFNNKFRVMANVPFSFISKANMSNKESKSGPGDFIVQGFYRLYNRATTTKNNSRLIIQDLWIGTGIKLPTGKYIPTDKDESGQSVNLFQLGTGSLDFMFMLMYDIRIQNIGLNLNSNYKLNTSNKHQYYYGNKWSNSAQLYYKLRIKNKWTLSPNTGISYEYAAKDLDEGYAIFNSGGNILYGTFGAEATFSKIAIGGNWQPVLSQNMARGSVEAHNRMMFHFSVLF